MSMTTQKLAEMTTAEKVYVEKLLREAAKQRAAEGKKRMDVLLEAFRL